MGGMGPGGPNKPETEEEKKAREERRRRRFAPKPASRIGKKKRRRGPAQAAKLPKGKCWRSAAAACHDVTRIVLVAVFPTAKCKLRQMKLERIKDFLLMEAEFIKNQQILRPQVRWLVFGKP